MAYATSGQVIQYEYPFKWKIENFSNIIQHKELIQLINQEQLSQSFDAGKLSRCPTQWYFSLFHGSYIEFDVNFKAGPSKYLAFGSCSIQIRDLNGEVVDTFQAGLKQLTPGVSSFSLRVSNRDLEDWEDGSIVIEGKLQLEFYARAEPLNLSEEVDEFKRKEFQILSESLRQMIDVDNQPEDGKVIKVISGDRAVFYAYTAILAGRFDYFKSIFDHEWMRDQDSLHFEYLSGKTLKVLLHYLIGGVLLDDWKAEDVILELTLAADMFRLERLFQFLDKVLPAISIADTEILKKMILLADQVEMSNAGRKLFSRFKESVDNPRQLFMDYNEYFME